MDVGAMIATLIPQLFRGCQSFRDPVPSRNLIHVTNNGITVHSIMYHNRNAHEGFWGVSENVLKSLEKRPNKYSVVLTSDRGVGTICMGGDAAADVRTKA